MGDALRLLDEWFDPATAQSWDAVGTVCGDPQAPLRRVLLAVDPVRAVVDEALAYDADLLVVHHPLLLRPVHGVPSTTPKGRLVHDLVRAAVTLHVCHTNADSAVGGVSESLALALGLVDVEPLQPEPAEPMDKLVVFVPHDDLARVTGAVTGAGAGALGDYDRCTFVATGTGSFRPLPGAQPAIGTVGRVEQVSEARLETVLPRRRRGSVLAALRASHPYEEPAFDLLEMAALPGTRGSGRLGRLPRAEPLADFAARVVAALPATASAARVAGDPGGVVERVALCGGAGDFLLDAARASGADVYVTSDLRHHPVSELLEHAYAGAAAPAVVDVPHMAAEWTWLPRLAARLRSALARTDTTVEVRVSTTGTDPWTAHLPMTGTPATRSTR